MTGKRVDLVRFVTPFGSPAWLTPAEAETLRAQDDELWLELQAIDALTTSQRAIGPPRIEAGR